MTSKLIIAPPATGKTAACIAQILAVQKEHSLAQVWVLVPNPQKAAYFKVRLALADGGMGVKVGAFRNFYQEILEENGTFAPIISASLSHRLIQEVVREAAASGELFHYNAIKDKPGFLSVMRDAFAELRSALVQPSVFLEYTRDSSPAHRELAVLYDRFLARLEALGWVDGEGQAWLAIKALETNPSLTKRLSLVIVDGFTSFTAAQRQFLKLLGQQSGEMIITLTGDLGSNRQVDGRSIDVLKGLQETLSPDIRELSTDPRLPAEILHMERHVLDPGESEKLDTTKPLLLEARSQSDEAREALRWIKQLHVRQHVPLDSFAIYAANLEMYQPLLRSAADEFGLRVHFSQSDPLSESPAVLALLALLQLPLDDYPSRLLLNTLRSPYFNFGLEAKDLEDLESVSQQAIIVSGKDQWDDAWPMLQRSNAAAVEHLDEERRRKSRTAGIDLPALRLRLEHFWQLYSQIENSRSQTEWVEWLENTLNQLGFYDRIESERDREACNSLGDALRALLLSESVVGKIVVDYPQFLADLQGTLLGARVEEPREARRNAVFIGKIVEARGARYEAVVLMGLSEGIFPIVENPDPFLDEELRGDLGLEQRIGRHQASTFYQAFTRANRHLLLTRPYLTEEGEKWQPSPYWQSTLRLFSQKAIEKVQKYMGRSQVEAASSQELLFFAVQQGQLQYTDDDVLNQRWQNLAMAHGILDARRSKYARGIYEGDLSQLAGSLERHFSAVYDWSASKLEAYSDCPFHFFIDSVLSLELIKAPEPGLDVAQKGTLYHKILELVYSISKLNQSNPLELLDSVAEGVFRNAPESLGFRPSVLWQIERNQYLETLRKSLEALEAERGEWQPIGFEQNFGIKNTPLLELEINGDTIRLHGVIDRIDSNPSGEIRVIDYKSGGSHLSVADLNNGTRLQLPIYGMAAQRALRMGEVIEGFYWNINGASSSPLKLSGYKFEQLQGPEAAYQVATDHIIKNVTGIRQGNFLPERPKEGCPNYCPASKWCWRYEAKGNYD